MNITRIDLNNFKKSIQSYYEEKKNAFKYTIKHKLLIRRVYYFSNGPGPSSNTGDAYVNEQEQDQTPLNLRKGAYIKDHGYKKPLEVHLGVSKRRPTIVRKNKGSLRVQN
tara:strand:+ start:120 stop:449 length:330 start_codon:yes stop_codon:yes gene_type:complete